MTAPNLNALDQRRRDLLAELRAVEAEIAQNGRGDPIATESGVANFATPKATDPFAAEVTLCQAAYAWNLTASGAWRRAVRLQEVGLARRIRPGGWRIAVAALEDNQPNRTGGRHG